MDEETGEEKSGEAEAGTSRVSWATTASSSSAQSIGRTSAAASRRARTAAAAETGERQVMDESYQLEKALLRELRPARGASASEPARERRTTFHYPETSEAKELASSLRAPNGFRRHFLNQQAAAAGVPEEERPGSWRASFLDQVRPLLRVGYFQSVLGVRVDQAKGASAAHEGKSGTLQTVFALIKCFIGSGITFMPFAFSMGGWLFSSVVIVSIALVNAWCISLLVQCSTKTGCLSFGEVAKSCCGWPGKIMVQVSLVMGQFGTCIAYIIFVTQLAESLSRASRSCVILVQFLVLVPLCNVRSVHLLEYPNLVADVLLLFGLLVVLIDIFHALGSDSQAAHCLPFKQRTYGIFIGTAIFTFEGIPMMLPIRNAMEEPGRFMGLFCKVFAFVILMFILMGNLGYAGYGSKSELVVLLNLPKRSVATRAVKACYMVALVLGLPLMFLPAAHITESWALGGDHDETAQKGQQRQQPFSQLLRRELGISFLRFVEVVLFALVAFKGDAIFAKFLALCGAVCCAPVAFIYPALCHLMLCACTKAEKIADVCVLIFGLFASGLTLCQALF